MKDISRLYQYFFFKLYLWNLKAFGKEDLPVLNALLHLSLLMFVNLMTLILIVKITTGISLIDFKRLPVTLFAVIALAVLLFNYFNLVYNSRTKSIISLYNDESEQKRIDGNKALAWYIGLSILALLIVLAF